MSKIITTFLTDVIDPNSMLMEDSSGLGVVVYCEKQNPITDLGVSLISYFDEYDVNLNEELDQSNNSCKKFERCHKTLNSLKGKRLKITIEEVD